MKKIPRVSLIGITIGLGVLLANSWHVLSEWTKNKPDELFTAIAHYFVDYFLYISLIAQGGRGALIFTDHLFTNEPLRPTWIYWFYTIIGKLMGFGLTPFAAYNISILILGAILLGLLWRIIRRLIPKAPTAQLTAFLFVVTASNFPRLGEFWFSPTPALNRLGGVPHQIFQTILLLLIILIFSSLLNPTRPPLNHESGSMNHAKNKKKLLCSTIIHHSLFMILVFLAATANPIQMLLLVISAFLVLLIEAWGNKIFADRFPSSKTKDPLRGEKWHATLMSDNIASSGSRKFWFSRTPLLNALMLFAMLALPALLGAYLVNTEFARQPILILAKQWEDSQRISVSLWQFFLAMGPIACLIPFGIYRFLKYKTPLHTLLLLYGTGSILAFFSPIPTLLQTSPVRWLSPAAYAIFPVIAALGAMEVSRLTAKMKHGKTNTRFSAITIGILLAYYLFFTIPSLLNQIQARQIPLETDTTLQKLNHIDLQILDALHVINKTPVSGIVLTDPVLPYDILIPSFGTYSFTGQPIHTLFPTVKDGLRKRFFEGTMNEQGAKQFLSDHRIGLIFASAVTAKTLPSYYPFISELFKNEVTVIYSIRTSP